MGLSSNVSESLRVLSSEYTVMNTEDYFSNKSVIRIYRNLPESLRKPPYRNAAKAISEKFKESTIRVDQIQIKLWSILSDPDFDNDSLSPPSASQLDEHECHPLLPADRQKINEAGFLSDGSDWALFPVKSQHANQGINQDINTRKTGPSSQCSAVQKLNKIFGGRKYIQKVLTDALPSAGSAIQSCLAELETKFTGSGAGLFNYYTKIQFLSEKGKLPVYKISKGVREGTNTCTLFFYHESDQLRVIAMGQHVDAARNHSRAGMGCYQIHWSLPSLRLPPVIRLDRPLTITEKDNSCVL